MAASAAGYRQVSRFSRVQGYFLKANSLVDAWIPREFAVPTYHLPAMPSSDPYSLHVLKLRKSLWECLEYTYHAVLVQVTARIHRVYLVEHRHLILNCTSTCVSSAMSPYKVRISDFPSRSQCRSLLDFTGLHQAEYTW